MFFSVSKGNFAGILRRYKSTGRPKIKLYPSSCDNKFYAENIFQYDRTVSHAHWASSSEEGLNAQFVVKIVPGILMITNYSIFSHDSSSQYMQAWTLEGSNDNKTYTMLHNKTQNTDLANSGVGIYEVNQEMNYFQYFRIKQTMKTLAGSQNMRIFNLEFFGKYVPFSLITRKYCRNRFSNLPIVAITLLICYS